MRFGSSPRFRRGHTHPFVGAVLRLLLSTASHVLFFSGIIGEALVAPPAAVVDVWIQEGRDFPQGWVAFVGMYLIDSQGGRVHLHTTTHESGAGNPVWDEKAGQRGGVVLPPTGILEFEVLDIEWNAPKHIGYVFVNVSKIVAGDSSVIGTKSYELTKADGVTPVTGHLTIQITPVEFYGQCVVRIDSASGLSNGDAFEGSDSDPFVIVRRVNPTPGYQMYLYETREVENNHDPEWTVVDHGSRKGDVLLPMTGELAFEVREDDGWRSALLGQAKINIADIIAGDTSVVGVHTHPLNTQGTLTVEISALQEKPPIVNIWVENGRGLDDVDHWGIADPFVTVYIDHEPASEEVPKTELYTTTIQKDTLNPNWTVEEGAKAGVMLPAASGTLAFEIQDEHKDGANSESFGWVKIDVDRILARDPSVIGTHAHPVVLENGSTSSEDLGTLTVRIEPVAFFAPCAVWMDLNTAKACVDKCRPEEYWEQDSKQCLTCGAGEQLSEHKTKCDMCAAGKVNSETDAAAGTECRACPGGEVPNEDKSDCVPNGCVMESSGLCPADCFKTPGATLCTKCPQGQTSVGDGQKCCPKKESALLYDSETCRVKSCEDDMKISTDEMSCVARCGATEGTGAKRCCAKIKGVTAYGFTSCQLTTCGGKLFPTADGMNCRVACDSCVSEADTVRYVLRHRFPAVEALQWALSKGIGINPWDFKVDTSMFKAATVKSTSRQLVARQAIQYDETGQAAMAIIRDPAGLCAKITKMTEAELAAIGVFNMTLAIQTSEKKPPENETAARNVSIIVGSIFGAVVPLGLIVLCICCLRKKMGKTIRGEENEATKMEPTENWQKILSLEPYGVTEEEKSEDGVDSTPASAAAENATVLKQHSADPAENSDDFGQGLL